MTKPAAAGLQALGALPFLVAVAFLFDGEMAAALSFGIPGAALMVWGGVATRSHLKNKIPRGIDATVTPE